MIREYSIVKSVYYRIVHTVHGMYRTKKRERTRSLRRALRPVTVTVYCTVWSHIHIVEASALRSIVLRYAYAGVPIATRISFFLSFFFVAFSEYIYFLYPFRFLFVWRVRRTFFPSGRYFFYIGTTTGWIFDISLCENSIKINQS